MIFYGQDSARRDCVPDTTKLAYSRDRGSLASGFKPTQHRVSIPDAPLYVAPTKDYSPPFEYMTMEAFLRHPNRVVDTTLEDPIDPPAHAQEVCGPVAIQGVVFPPGCYKFLAKGYQGIALRVRHDDPTAAWSTYRHIARRQADLHATPGTTAHLAWVANRLAVTCRTLPVDDYTDT